ncbi:MAG TPA: ABC transporter permease [Opitutaceae bacterium]
MLHDIRLAFRQLGKSPVFTIVTLLTLALGIGANTTIFSMVNSVILRPLPFDGAERLVKLGSRDADGFWGLMIGPVALKLFEESKSFESLSLVRNLPNLSLMQDGYAQKVEGLEVSSDFLDVFGVKPVLGRDFTAAEGETGGNNNVVILAHRFWLEHVAGSPNVLGQTIILNSTPHEIVGVLGPDALLQDKAALLTPRPIRMAGHDWRMNPQTTWAPLTGRLKPGVSLAQAEAELKLLSAQVIAELPPDAVRDPAAIEPLQDWMTGGQARVVYMLLGGVVLVLLIACANVANLLLARATTRTKEMAVRSALGANANRLMRQILTESLVLALLGGVLGVGLSFIGVGLLNHTMPVSLPLLMRPELDTTVLLFSVLIACGTGVFTGIVPAWRARGIDVNNDLKDGGRGTTSGGRSCTQSLLVIGEVAMTVILLIGAGLLLRSFDNTLNVDPGFRPGGVIAAELSLAEGTFEGDAAVLAYYREVRRELAALPGVDHVATVNTVPFSGQGWGTQVWATDNPDRKAFQWGGHDLVGGDYFATMGIRLLRGRVFTEDDNQPGAPPRTILGEGMAKLLFPGGEAVGKRVDCSGATWEVIGVVSDVRYYRLNEPVWPRVYKPQAFNAWTCSVVVHTQGSPESIIAPIRETLRRINPDQAVSNIRLVSMDMGRSLSPQRMTLNLVTVFAASALALACLGIYGVMAYTIEQRKRELCIRMALGAVGGNIRGLVMRDGMRLGAVGLAIGLVGGLIGARLMASLLFEVTPFDPPVFGATCVVLAILIWISLLIPAWRATRNDPIHALRSE